MGLAADWQRMVAERGDKSLEFAGGSYRLSLNPIEDKWTEVGFILWRIEGDGAAVPVATGQADGDDLVVDAGGAFSGDRSELEALLGRLTAGEPVAATGSGHANEQAIPTGGINDAPGWPTTDAAETERGS